MKKIFTKKLKIQLSNLAIENKIDDIITILDNYLIGIKDIKTNTNEYNILKFSNWLKYGGKLPYKVFTIGNSKLPFLSFSVLPGVTCPGAGACLDYCYSFKAWRQPAPFFRQLQNTLLMLNNFDKIKTELNNALYTKKGNLRSTFSKIDKNKIDFRLYVDGDFSSLNDLENWMQLLKENKILNAYGYSKSLNLFLQLHDQGYKFPKNYILNLSNGGKYGQLKPILINLPFVRGNFTAVKGDIKTIRKQFKNKVFVCPGDCGSCTKIGHACGNMDVFNKMEIVIPIH